MKINHIATAEKCKLLNCAELARQCGVKPPVVHHVISGTYWSMGSEGAQRVITKLRELGFLVEELGGDDIAA